VPQEGEAEWSVAADTIVARFCDVGDLVDRIGAQVGELFRLEAAPSLLDGIDLRCVARQWLDA